MRCHSPGIAVALNSEIIGSRQFYRGGFDRAPLNGPGAKEAESGASQPGCRRRRQPGKPEYVSLI